MRFKIFNSLIFFCLIFTISCGTDLWDSNESSELDSEDVEKKIFDSMESEPENFDACLTIIEDNLDIFNNNEFDSTIASSVLEKFSDGKIIRVLDGRNVKFSSDFLNKSIAVDSVQISFEYHDEGLFERGISDLFSSISYPIAEIRIRCRVIKRSSTKDFWKIEPVMPDVIKNFYDESIMDVGTFIVTEENVAGPLGMDNSYYKTDVTSQREIVLRSKLWSKQDVTISNRTQKIFTALNVLKNIENLKINLKLTEYEENINYGGQGETVYTGPRGGKYVIRNGQKRYLPRN